MSSNTQLKAVRQERDTHFDIITIIMYDVTFFIYFVLTNLAIIVRGRENANSNDYFFLSLAQKKRLVIDTDAGSDDGVALLNILGSENLFHDVEVHFISAVFGNTHVDNVAKNVLKVLKTVNRLDVPVYKGANQSLLVTPFYADNFFGKDGFGDFYFSNPPSEDLIKNKHAVLALIEEANTYPGQLTLVCLGPLTNIALAIRLDTKFFSRLKEIYILGGSDSGIGNIKPGVEFNFYVDPEAAFIVLKEAEKNNKVLNLVSWETASIRSVVNMNWRKNVLGVIRSPQINLINKAENLTLHGENWISSDTVLSSVVIDGRIIESSDVYHARVETFEEHSRGALILFYNSNNLTKNVCIIKKINIDRYKKMILQNLSPQEGQRNGASRI